MILFRVWELRVGRLTVRDEDVPDTFFSIDRMEESADEFFGKLKTILLHTLVLVISGSVITLRHLRKVITDEYSKLSTRLPKYFRHIHRVHDSPRQSAGSSFFLKNISEHKEHVRKENGYHEN
jgi:hypothetical protein